MFVIVLLILSVPLEVIMLPLYKQMTNWGLMDSYIAIVLPFVAHASTIFFSDSISWDFRSRFWRQDESMGQQSMVSFLD